MCVNICMCVTIVISWFTCYEIACVQPCIAHIPFFFFTEFDLDALLASSLSPAKSRVTLQLPKDQFTNPSKQLPTPSPSTVAGRTSTDSLLKHGQRRSLSFHCTATSPDDTEHGPVSIVVHHPGSDESLLRRTSLTSTLSSCSKEVEGRKEEEEGEEEQEEVEEEEEEAEVSTTGAAQKSFSSSKAGWRPIPRLATKDGPPEVSGL